MRWLASSVLLVLSLSVSDRAHAAPSAAERETARRLMDEGKARLKENDHARAIDAFQKAHEIMHVPTTGLAVARAHLAAGHLVEARDAALEVGRLPREKGEPAVFESARKHAKDLDGQLKPRIPLLRLKLKGGNVAHVMIDDVEVPPAIIGEPIAVNPGKRVVVAKSGAGAEVRGEVEIAERETKEIELVLPEGQGVEAAKTTPPASSKSAEPAPAKVRSFGTDAVDEPRSARTPLALGLMYGGAGVAAAGVIVGSVTGAMTVSRATDVTQHCENDICAPSVKGDLDSARTLATVSTIGFVAAGVGLAALGAGLLLPRATSHASTKRAASPSVWIGATGLGGTF